MNVFQERAESYLEKMFLNFKNILAEEFESQLKAKQTEIELILISLLEEFDLLPEKDQVYLTSGGKHTLPLVEKKIAQMVRTRIRNTTTTDLIRLALKRLQAIGEDFSAYHIMEMYPAINIYTLRTKLKLLLDNGVIEIVKHGRGKGSKTLYRFTD